MTVAPILLSAMGLSRDFPLSSGGLFGGSGRRSIKALDEVSFDIGEGETLGLIGESGCGKTTTARLLLDLDRPTEGAVLFHGVDLRRLSRSERRDYRRSVQAVFQDPQSSLSPRMRIGEIVGEPLIASRVPRLAIHARVAEALEQVGIDPSLVDRFPHQFSGGQQQRIAIARTLAVRAALVVLDEPLSSLDVSVRSQILTLLKDLQTQHGVSYLMISHDMAAAAHICDRIAVMYLGRIVEMGTVEEIYDSPRHPYTQALLASARIAFGSDASEEKVLDEEPPSPINSPTGCRYQPRCAQAMTICSRTEPLLPGDKRLYQVACHLWPAREEDHDNPRLV
ncbi:MAG: ABC transporter ATP-binding protein [Hyphomicrobiales bacterium]|nr:ABC transporter ATP-binding protein [Hyphomicrobiales bacterium]